MEKRRSPIWLIPNLLSLDAPLVALAWMWMLAHALRVEYIPASSWWVLPIAVWCVYVLDRVIDNWVEPELRESSPRHRFHWRWRWPLLVGVLAAGVFCAYEALYVMPRSMFSAGLVLVVLCAFYFALAWFRTDEVPYVKNFLAGMIFAMGVGIPVNAANASLLVADFNDVIYAYQNTGIVDAIWNFGIMALATLRVIFYYCPEVWVFGVLCMMNITAIDLWEKADESGSEEVIDANESTLTLGLIILAGGSLVFAAIYADEYSKPFFYAVMVAAALLQAINHFRNRMELNTQRVLADLVLLAPLPIFLLA